MVRVSTLAVFSIFLSSLALASEPTLRPTIEATRQLEETESFVEILEGSCAVAGYGAIKSRTECRTAADELNFYHPIGDISDDDGEDYSAYGCISYISRGDRELEAYYNPYKTSTVNCNSNDDIYGRRLQTACICTFGNGHGTRGVPGVGCVICANSD